MEVSWIEYRDVPRAGKCFLVRLSLSLPSLSSSFALVTHPLTLSSVIDRFSENLERLLKLEHPFLVKYEQTAILPINPIGLYSIQLDLNLICSIRSFCFLFLIRPALISSYLSIALSALALRPLFRYHAGWVDRKNRAFVFISEMVTGDLRNVLGKKVP